MARMKAPFDGNQAAAEVAHAVNEVCAIYPITPSSNLGEICDYKSSQGETNIWGNVPVVSELQSEGGASGAVHGSLATGAMTSTFTASQGLLLMIPNMYKIAGELTPTTFYVTARTVAAHALSIFGDHSDVMACRQTGWAMMAGANVQEAHDLALICQASTLKSRIPFLSFYDGFRTSHEIQKIELLTKEDMRSMIDDSLIREARSRALTPDKPSIKGTAQNPDVFFQSREACNSYYDKCADIVEEQMNIFGKMTGRQYKLFDYYGAPDAERVIIIMGSAADATQEMVDYLNAKGEKVGVVSVHLYRPFSVKHFLAALPVKTVKAFAVMDRTKEPGSLGEPMYEDVRTAFGEAMQENKDLFGGRWPTVIGGRYGLSCKECTPAMAKAVFDELKKDKPKNHFTIGIHDDVTNTSLEWDETLDIEADDVRRCLFYGLGSDGTVGANKNSIKIIADHTDNYAQGYFVYDSKKAGAITTSHLRFGPRPIKSTYLIHSANFIACHQWSFLERYDMLKDLKEGGVFLLNSIYGPDEVWDKLPREVQQRILDKKAKFYVIDAYAVAQKAGMGGRINTIMQTCFFNIADVIPADKAIEYIKTAIKKTYSKAGDAVVDKNNAAVDQALAHLNEVNYAGKTANGKPMPPIVSDEAPQFVLDTLSKIMVNEGDCLPVSKLPQDGTFPTGTTQWEKRNIALQIPVWEPDICIQCGKCSAVCPHATIRMKIYDPKLAEGAPSTFKTVPARGKQVEGKNFTLQVFPEDCTGCGACVATCPAKSKENPEKKAINMHAQPPLRDTERENLKFFEKLPYTEDGLFPLNTIKGSQLRRPLFEFSGACAGCGETPYIKLATQLFGDRMLVANATGCSSIYGGNLPTTPYTTNCDGRGPAWANSLFEDNAEFGFGMRLAADKFMSAAMQQISEMAEKGCLKDKADLVKQIVEAKQVTQEDIDAQRERVAELRKALDACGSNEAKNTAAIADYLVKKSVWIVGGDGWAYDIGYGGLDHVLASGKNVNVLVLDTEVYSNTGGQASKSTPLGAVARFAEGGKATGKKDLGMIAMTYGNIYVAKVAMGANDAQVVKAFQEAEAYDGPSLIIAYSHCIAHGIRGMADGLGLGFAEQKKAVESGHFPLYRFNPDLIKEGKNPLQLDSKSPTMAYKDWAMGETRFQTLAKRDPEMAEKYAHQAAWEESLRWKIYEQMSKMEFGS
ncbi:MAG: pyruvate:ferredoxin (flavodoxin) oxidoreductase [Planctomycetaceae bacterium]|nr:pyruvate:ferredoxin (flavodoxin) oxidoreductase [Planctomycetaceae bacterium]